jgi:hypothetical protein
VIPSRLMCRRKVRYRVRGGVSFGAVLASMWLATATPALAASDAERAAARTAANDGAEAYDQKRWADALDRFQRAESLVHSPVHLLYIARAQAQLGRLVEAHESYTRLSRETLAAGSPAAFAEAQRNGGTELEQLEHRLPYVTVVLEGAGQAPVDITLDGHPFSSTLVGLAVPLDPGEHQLEAKSTGLASEPVRVTVAEGAKQQVVLSLHAAATAGAAPAAAPPAPVAAPPPKEEHPQAESGGGNGMRIGAYAAFGVGAVGIAAGTIFAIKASGKHSDADALCNGPGGQCPVDSKAQIESLDDEAKSASTLSVVSFAVGGAAVATGVVLLVLGGKSSAEGSPAQTASVTPWIGLGSAGVNGRF